MKALPILVLSVGTAALTACFVQSSEDTALRFRSDVSAVTRVEDAKPNVFIPAFEDCRAPDGSPAERTRSDAICTNVSIAGATKPGNSFAKLASCEVVRTQRPYYPAKPAGMPTAEDPRLADAAFVREIEWARGELGASGCVCCHDAGVAPQGASQWDIRAQGNWLETVSTSGLALFAGFADSSVLGAYPADQNHGFDRTTVGVPTTDPARMKKLVAAELAHRGTTEEDARKVPPFGGPIYDNSVRPPTVCVGEGVAPDGRVVIRAGSARYVYVLEQGSKNPGAPPNLDRPAGTLWRLDVLASADPVASGFRYGTTPAGSFQDTPDRVSAPALVAGRTYQLTALRDVGIPTTNCLFTFGDPIRESPATPAAPPSQAFGATCTDNAGCSAPASYCALSPGQPAGYCTVTGCKMDMSVCPAGWGCFDLSAFQPGAPSFCSKP